MAERLTDAYSGFFDDSGSSFLGDASTLDETIQGTVRYLNEPYTKESRSKASVGSLVDYPSDISMSWFFMSYYGVKIIWVNM